MSCFWRSSASRSVPIWRMVHRSDRRVRIGFPFAIGRRGFPDDRLAAGCGSRPAAIVSAGPIYLLPLHSKTKGCPRQNRTAFSCPSRILVWKRSISAWKASPDSGPLPRKRKKRLSDHVCGDVYLFPETNSRCQGRSSLWSLIVLRKRNVVLESDTGDYRHFAMWRPLAVGCRYCRLAKRSEFRDYRVNLTYAEMRKIG